MSRRNIAANQRRSLDVMYQKLNVMSAAWADYDAEMMATLEELAASVKESIDTLTHLCSDDE
ncbi:hypothetical protein AAGW04_22460 [Pectobacterium aroidearum]|uniref:hypothetical protein n=1 Tax=Pectobacterium aroidearum TaxID=1201031 RepID=UPI00315916F7